MTATTIHEEMTIPEIVKAYPQTEKIFANHGIHIKGYKALEYENLSATARVHQLNLEQLLADLNKAVAG